MNSGYALTAVFCATLLTACGGRDLTTDQAKAMISEALAKTPTTEPLLTGMDNIGTATEAEYFSSPGGKYQKALEADGLITIQSKGKIYNPANKAEYFNALDIALTGKGKAFVTGTPNTVPAPSANTWPTVYENVVFCQKEVAEVSAPNVSNDFARVEYTWHAASLSPFAVHSHETDPSAKSECDPASKDDASATFERKDDVWTLTSAQ
jgi:hypothetical protein